MITAKELCDAFLTDEVLAEKKYCEQTLRISGFAVHVGPDLYGLPSVELSETKGGKSRVLCVLPFSDYLKLRKVSKGNEVIMEGKIRGFYDRDQTVVVKDCIIAEVVK